MGQNSGKEYYLGLDMGTASVGWAVTDTEYHVLRAKGKDMWGIREFDEAETAVSRRTNRISRRRRQRETARIGMVRGYFADAIAAVDPNFLQRLENSKYYLSDKDETVRTPNAIFDDPTFQDRDYYNKYPTIYHLRCDLLKNKEDSRDVRLVYLAVLNMFKRRGNFLNDTLDIDSDAIGADPHVLYDTLVCSVQECFEDGLSMPTDVDAIKIQEILGAKLSRKRRSENLAKYLEIGRSDTKLNEVVKGLCGLTFNLTVLFGEDVVDADGKKITLTFDSANFDEDFEKAVTPLEADQADIVLAMKAMYDNAVLYAIQNGKEYLSVARVETYEKHQKDLAILKDLYRRESRKAYDEMFRSYEKGSYSAYVGSCNSKNLNINGKHKKRRGVNKGDKTTENIYKKIRDDLKKFPDSKERQYILDEIDKEQLLPKQLSSANGVIPNQIHARELKRILENASTFLPFLNEIDESGLTVSERILELYTFTIPYYVGPLSENSERDGGNGWVVRKEAGPVLPWNLDDKIDQNATRERFIERLIRDCTYLRGEKVLPRTSLLYEKYCVLNEINNIKVNGEKLPVEVKQDLFNTLYKKGKKVTRKQIENHLVNTGVIAKADVETISGIDVQMTSHLSSYGKLYAIFGDDLEKDRYQEIAEDIIRQCTIYGDAKSELRKILHDKYANPDDGKNNILSEQNINRIIGMKFKDWGNLSREFLTLPALDETTDEMIPLINALWNTNCNLQELLSDRFHYGEELQRRQKGAMQTLSELRIEDLDDMYFSAPVKRMVWQTLQIIQEIEKVMGCAPAKIFVEMARSPEKNKKRTTSRADQFRELYKNIQDESHDWMQIIDDAEKNGTINSKKMFLYLTQMGKSMYTGKDIELSELFKKDSPYDIDHIYPRSQTKDDSLLNNLVLVEQDKNREKLNKYPIKEDIRRSMHGFWKSLLSDDPKRRLITKEKYARLTGTNELDEQQLAGFIARQMVETQQGTKSVANLLQAVMPQTKIVFSKASNVSDFRYHYNDEERERKGRGTWYFPKSRTINELHHAHDAYLNIVIGNVYDVKFGKPRDYIIKYEKNREEYAYNLGKMFDWDIAGAWTAGNDGTIAVIKKTLAKPSPLLTRMSLEGHGQITEATLHGRDETEKNPHNYLPLKANDERLLDVTRYGGRTGLATAYFTLIEAKKNGKTIRSIEVVPLYLMDRIKDDDHALAEYLSMQWGYEEVAIRYPRINLQSLLRLNGYYVYLTGKYDNNRHVIRNATQVFFNDEQMNYIRILEKGKKIGISKEKNISLYKTIVDKNNGGIISKRPTSVVEKLVAGEGIFADLPIDRQAAVLINALSLTGINGYSADLREIGGDLNTGKMRLSKNISKNSEVILIHRSVTGLYDNEVNLLTV